MGVVRERKTVCESAKTVPSNPESTVQSGYTTQDSEDEEHQESRTRRPPRQRLATNGALDLAFNRLITRHTGHRRARRIMNTRFLETLNEDAEFEEENAKSKFQLIMEESDDALELLESYEREQAENAKNTNALYISAVQEVLDVDPYLNIPRKIRMAINSRKNFQYDLLRSIEVLITRQLTHVNDTEFVHEPQTCYERLLVHAVAKYKGFHSETIFDGEKKFVKVFRQEPDTKDGDDTAEYLFLCDYIKFMRDDLELH